MFLILLPTKEGGFTQPFKNMRKESPSYLARFSYLLTFSRCSSRNRLYRVRLKAILMANRSDSPTGSWPQLEPALLCIRPGWTLWPWALSHRTASSEVFSLCFNNTRKSGIEYCTMGAGGNCWLFTEEVRQQDDDAADGQLTSCSVSQMPEISASPWWTRDLGLLFCIIWVHWLNWMRLKILTLELLNVCVCVFRTGRRCCCKRYL